MTKTSEAQATFIAALERNPGSIVYRRRQGGYEVYGDEGPRIRCTAPTLKALVRQGLLVKRGLDSWCRPADIPTPTVLDMIRAREAEIDALSREDLRNRVLEFSGLLLRTMHGDDTVYWLYEQRLDESDDSTMRSFLTERAHEEIRGNDNV